MKTRELIARLQAQDPSGELQVCSGNRPIYFVERLPAYYDGRLQMLIQDETRTDYNIVGYKITGRGEKVQLHIMDLEDCIAGNADLPLDVADLSEGAQREWIDLADTCRAETRAIDAEIEAKEASRKP